MSTSGRLSRWERLLWCVRTRSLRAPTYWTYRTATFKGRFKGPITWELRDGKWICRATIEEIDADY